MENNQKVPFLVTYYQSEFDGYGLPYGGTPMMAIVLATDADTAENELEVYLDQTNSGLVSDFHAVPFKEKHAVISKINQVTVYNNYPDGNRFMS